MHILGSQNVYGRAEGIADHYWFLLILLRLFLFEQRPRHLSTPFWLALRPLRLAPRPLWLALRPFQLALRRLESSSLQTSPAGPHNLLGELQTTFEVAQVSWYRVIHPNWQKV